MGESGSAGDDDTSGMSAMIAGVGDAAGAARAGVDEMARPGRPAALTDQITEALGAWLRNGRLRPGDKLPTEHELARHFGVSRATIRSAVGALRQRGLIVAKRGIGSFVANGSVLSNPLNEAEDHRHLIARNGAAAGVEFVSVATAAADEAIADALGLADGAPVLRSVKRFTADGEPVIYCVNHLDVALLGDDLVAAALADHGIIEPLFDFLEGRCGLVTSYQVTGVRAVLGETIGIEDFGLGPGEPLLALDEVGYADDNRPLWHSTSWFPDGPMRFELVRHRNRHAVAPRRTQDLTAPTGDRSGPDTGGVT